MINLGKFKILDNNITACDYEFIIQKIATAITAKKRLLASPIASQTLVLAKKDAGIKKTLDKFDYLLPDSQWVKWAINLLYGAYLKERVYGPELMRLICSSAEKNKWAIYLYGTDEKTLGVLTKKLHFLFPALSIVGSEPSVFRNLSKKEIIQLQNRLKKSNAHIIFIAIGSPNQEILAARLAHENKGLNTVIIPVGAAFDFISGKKKQAPKWVGRLGFEWLFRLSQEPKRLFKRYIIFGSMFFVSILFSIIKRNKLMK